MVHIYPAECDAKSVVTIDFGMQKKAPIWECFFTFIVHRENTYISRLLAIIFIHRTQ